MTEGRASDPGGFACARPAALDLAAPVALPVALALVPEEAERLRGILAGFLDALAEGRASQRAERVAGLLAALGPGPAGTVEIVRTGLAEGPEEIADFDRYFGVRRAPGGETGAGLLRGLLQAATAALLLAARPGAAFAEADLARQVAGFAAHARLIGRICGLEGLR